MSSKIKLEYGHFNWINLVLSSDLPFQGKAICLYLATFMNSKQEVAWPSQGRIVKELGISHSSLNRALNVVEEAGWILREKGDSKTSTRYYTAFPKALEKELLGSPTVTLGSPTGGLGSPTQGLGVVPQWDTNKQLNKQTNNRGRFAPPSVTEVAEYAKEKGYSINATKFVNYYESNGWMVGRNKMKSWKHAVANWASNDFNKSAPLLTEVAI